MPKKNTKVSKTKVAPAKVEKLLELHQVANRLSCSHSHVLNMINRNQIKAKNIGTLGRKCWRVLESELDRFY